MICDTLYLLCFQNEVCCRPFNYKNLWKDNLTEMLLPSSDGRCAVTLMNWFFDYDVS